MNHYYGKALIGNTEIIYCENMSMLEKFKVILKHYIEHSKEHTNKYLEWSEKLKDEDEEISRLLKEAVKKFREGEKILEEIYRKIS